ncbi:MAG: type II secretion system F family protein [Planctomycetaceae bacterium]|nr:type II secretion system F family protein [Planctomycetaceae bacterium]
MFGRNLPLKTVAIYCRSLSTLFETGVSARKAFKIAGEKAANSTLRLATIRIMDDIESGLDISDSLEKQEVFPDLMIGMVSVAEQTGSLPEILKGLADHYDNLRRMKRDFIGAIAWPVFQFIMAVFVIAMLILLLGWIAEIQGGEALDVLGWGLTGTKGALVWLGSVFGSLFVLFLAYRFLRANFEGQKYLDHFLMKIPVLGHCMRSFGIARFSWAYHLTQQSGMPVDQSIKASMRATNNGAFIGEAPRIIHWIEQGETVTEALRESQLFPDDVIEMIHVGENSGTVPEILHRLGPQFEDQAKRSLAALAAAFGWLVWLLVAGFIIYVVFTIMFWYVGMIQEVMP